MGLSEEEELIAEDTLEGLKKHEDPFFAEAVLRFIWERKKVKEAAFTRNIAKIFGVEKEEVHNIAERLSQIGDMVWILDIDNHNAANEKPYLQNIDGYIVGDIYLRSGLTFFDIPGLPCKWPRLTKEQAIKLFNSVDGLVEWDYGVNPPIEHPQEVIESGNFAALWAKPIKDANNFPHALRIMDISKEGKPYFSAEVFNYMLEPEMVLKTLGYQRTAKRKLEVIAEKLKPFMD